MRTKSQISFFAILGLAIVIAIAFFAFKSSTSGTMLLKSQDSVASFSSAGESLKSYVDGCLRETSEEALNKYGLIDSYNKIEGYIQENIEKCIDFSLYENQGFEIVKSSPVAYITVLDETILITLKYPIDLKKDGSLSHLEEFRIDFPRTAYTRTDEVKNKDVYLSTENNAAHLKIPQGIKITMPDGETIDKISLKVIDNNFDGIANSAVIGSMAFEGKPDGAQFDPPIDLTLRFKKEDIPVGVDPQSLAVAWYDKENDMWRSVPSHVDVKKGVVVGKVKHFTNLAITYDCNPDAAPRKKEIDLGYVYLPEWWPSGFPENLNPDSCNSPYWISGTGTLNLYSHPNKVLKKINTDDYNKIGKSRKFYQNSELQYRYLVKGESNFRGSNQPEECISKEKECEKWNAYPTFNDVGGYGILTFYIKSQPGGGAQCFPETDQPTVKAMTGADTPEKVILKIECSTGDNCPTTESFFTHVLPDSITSIPPRPSPEFSTLSATKPNYLVVKVNNLASACAYAKAKLIFNTGLNILNDNEFLDPQTLCTACGGDKERQCQEWCTGMTNGCKPGNNLCASDKKCYQKTSDCKTASGKWNIGNYDQKQPCLSKDLCGGVNCLKQCSPESGQECFTTGTSDSRPFKYDYKEISSLQCICACDLYKQDFNCGKEICKPECKNGKLYGKRCSTDDYTCKETGIILGDCETKPAESIEYKGCLMKCGEWNEPCTSQDRGKTKTQKRECSETCGESKTRTITCNVWKSPEQIEYFVPECGANLDCTWDIHTNLNGGYKCTSNNYPHVCCPLGFCRTEDKNCLKTNEDCGKYRKN